MAKDTPGKLKSLEPLVPRNIAVSHHWVLFLDAVRVIYPDKAQGLLEVAKHAEVLRNKPDALALLERLLRPDTGLYRSVLGMALIPSCAQEIPKP